MDRHVARGPRVRRAVSRLTALALIGAGGLAFSVTGPGAEVAHAASGDGELNVRVIRDMGANGAWDPVIDLGLAGVKVTVTDAFGASVDLTTDASGVATLPAGDTRLAGGKYRIDVANPDKDYYSPAFASIADPADTPSDTRLSSNQEFVDVAGGVDATVTTGFMHARDYCQSNPKVANACQPGIFSHGIAGAETGPRDTVFITNYRDSDYVNLAKSASVGGDAGTGSVFGIAYNRLTKKVFSAAYAKRNVDYGDAGPGGVYITDVATGSTSVFTTVPDAGTTLHSLDQAGGKEDVEFRKAVGKESLGTIVMSDDYKSLFVMNLNNKKVYVYDATGTTAAAPSRTIDVSTSPCPAGTIDSDWRPTGLGEQDGVLYVGGVCSGESEATVADAQPDNLRAIVMSFDEVTGSSNGVIMDEPLNFVRTGSINSPCVTNPAGTSSWQGWSDDLLCTSTPDGSGGGIAVAPQPMLLKIIAEPNGDLDLNFRDRNADMYGRQLAAYMKSTGAEVNPAFITAGSLNRACLGTSGDYVMDSNGGCGVDVTSPVSTFYNQNGGSPHGLSSFAGMTRSRAEVGLVTNNMDAGGPIVTNGIAVRSNATGDWTGDAQTIGAASGQYNAPANSFGKGAGLADMDVLCDLAPIQIGNRVWYNDAADGSQQPGENPVVGATVNLYDASGTLVATTVTNDRGEYYFDSLTTAGLDYDTDYVVKMDNPDDYAAGGPLDGSLWDLTKLGNGPDGNKAEAGADGYPAISLTTGKPGETNHDYDFGFVPVPSIHIVKYDGRLTGPVDGPLSHADNKKKPTVYEAQSNGYTGKQPVGMIVTNDGNAALGDVKVTDKTLSKPKMTGLTCDFSALGGPATGTKWDGLFLPGDSFPCTGRINLEAGQKHADEVSVVGTQYNPLTGEPVTGKPKVSDKDRYYAKTGYTSKIVITKRDAKSGEEADKKKDAMFFKSGKKRTILMPVTNVGTSPISKVVVSDKTLSGQRVTNFRCVFPDGKKVKANRKGQVKWQASFRKSNPKTWKPGDTFKCRASLSLRPGAKVHGDKVTVTGKPPQGKKLHSRDTFWAKTRAGLAGTPSTGYRIVPDTLQR